MVPEIPLHGRAPATCPVCQGQFAGPGNKLFCSKLCRDTDYRRRKQSKSRPINIQLARPRRVTVYQCDGCKQRSLDTQRCQGCGTCMRKVGLGGLCPHCDQPVTVVDVLDKGVMSGGIK